MNTFMQSHSQSHTFIMKLGWGISQLENIHMYTITIPCQNGDTPIQRHTYYQNGDTATV